MIRSLELETEISQLTLIEGLTIIGFKGLKITGKKFELKELWCASYNDTIIQVTKHSNNFYV